MSLREPQRIINKNVRNLSMVAFDKLLGIIVIPMYLNISLSLLVAGILLT